MKNEQDHAIWAAAGHCILMKFLKTRCFERRHATAVLGFCVSRKNGISKRRRLKKVNHT